MSILTSLASAREKARTFMRALAYIADCDPVEEQRRWILALEQRLRTLEDGVQSGSGGRRDRVSGH
jgi:hypothetical protein